MPWLNQVKTFKFYLFMASKSVLGKPNSIAHLPKQGFNMSQKLKFTSAAGQLLPVYYDFLHPGEKIRASFDLFTRTQPLQTAAMCDIDEYIDLFFVPIRKLFSAAPELLQGIDDFGTSLMTGSTIRSQGNYFIPYLNLGSPNWTDPSTSGNYMPGTGSYVNNGQGFDFYYYGAMRLADMLGVNPYCFSAPVGFNDHLNGGGAGIDTNYHQEIYFPSINPMYFLAYQAIYYDYYRLSSWEGNDLDSYNIDRYYQSFNLISASDKSAFKKWFTLHYRPWQRDYFKSVEPSPIISSIGVSGYNVVSNLSALPSNVQGSDLPRFVNTGFTNPGQEVGQYNPSGRIGVQDIKSMFAWQKLLSLTGRAGKHYDDQVLAHYGFKIPQGVANESYLIGSHHQQIHIGEVISTADTASSGSGSALGQIAGKGYGKAVSDKFDFTAPCHGVLMAIYSCVPKLNYILNFDRLHTAISRFDLYVPEFDKLGMVPLYQFELNPSVVADGVNVEAWHYRYMEYKIKANRATNAFYLGRGSGFMSASAPFNDWSLTLASFNRAYPAGLTNLSYSDLYCQPWALDQIMLVGYDYNNAEQSLADYASWRAELYTRDPLIHDLDVTCYKVSTMSTFGLDDLTTL